MLLKPTNPTGERTHARVSTRSCAHLTLVKHAGKSHAGAERKRAQESVTTTKRKATRTKNARAPTGGRSGHTC